MKTCDIINEQPVIPKGEQSCLYGNLVYVRVQEQPLGWEGLWVALLFIAAMILPVVMIKYLEGHYD